MNNNESANPGISRFSCTSVLDEALIAQWNAFHFHHIQNKSIWLSIICGALIAPIGVLAACGKLPALLSLFCVILLVVKHRSNIGRLIRHKESKLSFKKDLSDKFDDEDF